MNTADNVVIEENRFESLSATKRFMLIATFIVILSLVFFLIAEVGVRTRMYFKHGSFWRLDIRELHHDTGIMLPKANVDNGRLTTNSFGFRSPELQPKNDNVLRFAFLGGSTTFSTEVAGNDATWPAIIMSQLAANYPNTSFDFLNASAIALTTADSLLNFQHRVVQHSPDIVFIYHAINDIVLDGYYEALRQNVIPPYDHAAGKRFNAVIGTSLLADLLYKNLKMMRETKITEGDLTGKVPFSESVADNFRQRLTTLITTSLETSKLVVIPTFTNMLRNGMDVDQQNAAMVTHSVYVHYYLQDDLLDALNSYNNVIREFADHPNVVVIESEDAIAATTENFVDSVHFSSKGSKRFGLHLADGLTTSSKVNQLIRNFKEQ